MNSTSFTYHGIKYQIDKITEIEPESGKKRIQIITKDKEVFNLIYNESIFRWVIAEPTQGIFKASKILK